MEKFLETIHNISTNETKIVELPLNRITEIMQMREQSIEKQNKINKQLEELKNKKEQIALKLNLTIEEVEILAEKL
jgi:hypothetical protein